MNVTVTARCVACQTEREIVPGEVPEGELPMCDKCFSPMVAVAARGTTDQATDVPWFSAPIREEF